MTITDNYDRKPIIKARQEAYLPPLADEMAAWTDRIKSVPVNHSTHTSGPQIHARQIAKRQVIVRPPPATNMAKKAEARKAIAENPGATVAKTAWIAGVSQSYISNVRRDDERRKK